MGAQAVASSLGHEQSGGLGPLRHGSGQGDPAVRETVGDRPTLRGGESCADHGAEDLARYGGAVSDLDRYAATRGPGHLGGDRRPMRDEREAVEWGTFVQGLAGGCLI